MIWIYRILFLPILILALPYYLRRMLKRGGYGTDFRHRLGLIPPRPPRPAGTRRVWIQAVSVGELQAVRPLIDGLLEQGNYEIVLTTTTSTGYRLARQLFQQPAVSTGLFPIDFWLCSATAWRRLQPDLAILMESELWPEHLRQAARRSCPVYLVNARLSDRSYRRYKRFRSLTRWLLSHLHSILAATQLDAQRYRDLAPASCQICTTGNLKFDVSIDPLLNTKMRDALRRELGFTPISPTGNPALILLGSSTWPGEEHFLLQVQNEALAIGIDCRLLLVPRHAERRVELIRMLSEQPLRWHVRSQAPAATQPVHIYLADTTGELARLTQVADLAFIGKSLPPNQGGQTPIEAAAVGLPTVYGPNMNNFRLICRSLELSGAARCGADAAQVKQQLLDLIADPQLRDQMSAAAKKWHDSNRGAALRTLDYIQS